MKRSRNITLLDCEDADEAVTLCMLLDERDRASEAAAAAGNRRIAIALMAEDGIAPPAFDADYKAKRLRVLQLDALIDAGPQTGGLLN